MALISSGESFNLLDRLLDALEGFRENHLALNWESFLIRCNHVRCLNSGLVIVLPLPVTD